MASSQKDSGCLQAKSQGENLPRIGGGNGVEAGRERVALNPDENSDFYCPLQGYWPRGGRRDRSPQASVRHLRQYGENVASRMDSTGVPDRIQVSAGASTSMSTGGPLCDAKRASSRLLTVPEQNFFSHI